jgi:hypothetical protein
MGATDQLMAAVYSAVKRAAHEPPRPAGRRPGLDSYADSVGNAEAIIGNNGW